VELLIQKDKATDKFKDIFIINKYKI